MVAEDTVADKTQSTSKIKDYALLLKLRLAFLVVLSALSGYLFVGGDFNLNFVYLIIGGFLITEHRMVLIKSLNVISTKR